MADEKWSYRFLKCRDCGTTENRHYASGYCESCYPNTTEYKVLEEFISGKSLADIGRDLGFSRERARQLLEKAISNEADNVSNSESSKEEKAMIRDTVKEEAKKNSYRLKYAEQIADKYDDMLALLESTSISSASNLLTQIGVSARASFIIDEDYPDISKRLFMNGNRWSTQHDCCVSCGTTETKHRSSGLCEQCYRKSEGFKEIQMRWRKENYAKFRASQKRYEREYYKRPEVKERQKIQGYQQRFGSKARRDAAIKQNGNKCIECGISRAEHRSKYGHDLSVLHIDGNLDNNDSDNLKPYCKSCSSRFAVLKK